MRELRGRLLRNVGIAALAMVLLAVSGDIPPGVPVTELPLCEELGTVRVSDGASLDEAPQPWVWPLEDIYQRCTNSLRRGTTNDGNPGADVDDISRESGAMWWPFEPLSNRGGLSLKIGAASVAGNSIVLSDITLLNDRPTQARIRSISVEASDEDGVTIARGTTGVAGVSGAAMMADQIVPAAGVQGPGRSRWGADIPLQLLGDRGTVPDTLTVTWEIQTYDRFYRLVPGSAVTGFLRSDDRADQVNDEDTLEPATDPVRISRRKSVCFTNVPPSTYSEAVKIMSLPFEQYFRPPSYTEPDDAYIVTIELVEWPRWTEIEKSGSVVGERPLKDSEGREVTGGEIPVSQGGAWEFCIANVRARVVDVSTLDQ